MFHHLGGSADRRQPLAERQRRSRVGVWFGRTARPPKRPDAAGSLVIVAGCARQLAVLLEAGVVPAVAWRLIAESEPHTRGAVSPVLTRQALDRAAGAAARAEDVAEALVARGSDQRTARFRSGWNPARARPVADSPERQAWGLFASCWAVACVSGSPLASCLRVFGRCLDSAGATRRELEVAFATPRATAQMAQVLPPIGLLLGMAFGFSSVEILFCTRAGWVCLGLSLVLMVLARLWSKHIITRSTPRDLAPGLDNELFAVALSGGASIARARELAREARERYSPAGRDRIRRGHAKAHRLSGHRASGQRFADGEHADGERIDRLLGFAEKAGVPVVALLRADAERARADAEADARAGAASAGVRLLLPVGFCVLPAFVLLGVVPVVLSLMTLFSA